MSTQRQSVVVAGGAGYLGRCLLDVLWAGGYAPICFDNFSSSRRFEDRRFPIIETDLTDARRTREQWNAIGPVKAVFHFAAKALVSESHEKPALYFQNNLLSTITLAELAAQNQVPLVHSSSCAVYGTPDAFPIDETQPLAPISPYGETKKMAESILSHFAKNKGLRTLNLRYFNPGGTLEGSSHGECHEPETHLIPNTVAAALQAKPVFIYGTDYPTADGSCIRDFIHVQDLLEGHLQALEYLVEQPLGFHDGINLGSGKGVSVLEVVSLAESVMDRPIERVFKDRRPGDPPRLVADISKATRVLSFRPKRSMRDILQSHLAWATR